MKEINLFNTNFFIIKNLLNKDVINKIIKDINFEIENNFCKDLNVPKYQTYPYLFDRYKNKLHWKKYFNKINDSIKNFEKKYVITKCWANVIKSKSNYGLHTHDTDITTVYFIKNSYKEFGTYFNFNEMEFIIPGEENSLLIFNGKLPHATTMPPEILCVNDPRYTLVTDYNETF
jgi:hypothetical protein